MAHMAATSNRPREQEHEARPCKRYAQDDGVPPEHRVKETAAAFAAILIAGEQSGRATMAKKPVIVKPGQDYLAVVCVKCSQLFPVEASRLGETGKGPPFGPVGSRVPLLRSQGGLSSGTGETDDRVP